MNTNALNALQKWRDNNPDQIGVRKNPIQKLAEKPTSRSLAISACCYNCMGREPGWRNEVKRCTSYECPLYAFRPGAKEGDWEVCRVANEKHINGVEEEWEED